MRSVLEAEALRQLAGLGDAAAGEWRETGDSAFHIRRRLTEAEQAAIGPAVDIRRTPEARARAAALGSLLRLAPVETLRDEIGLLA